MVFFFNSAAPALSQTKQADTGTAQERLCTSSCISVSSNAFFSSHTGRWHRSCGQRWNLPGWFGAAVVGSCGRHLSHHHSQPRRGDQSEGVIPILFSSFPVFFSSEDFPPFFLEFCPFHTEVDQHCCNYTQNNSRASEHPPRLNVLQLMRHKKGNFVFLWNTNKYIEIQSVKFLFFFARFCCTCYFKKIKWAPSLL